MIDKLKFLRGNGNKMDERMEGSVSSFRKKLDAQGEKSV